MNNGFGLKMIAVIELSKLRLYEAKGIKIIRKIEELPIDFHKEPRHEKGSYHGTSTPNSAFEPHTSIKDQEHQTTSKIVVSHLEKIITHNSDYHELMIAAEPKTLGYIRSELTKPLKKILTKEIVKDLAHKNMQEIEHIFFS